MNIIKEFTLKNLRLNKKRSIVTIIGVMLSTALIIAVAGMVTSTLKTTEEMYIANEGNYHVSFQDVPKQDLKYIKDNINVKSYFLTTSYGYAKLKDSQNDNKPYAYVIGFTKMALENNGIKLTDGRLPEKEDEITIPENLLSNGRINYKIGDTITLDIGTRELIESKKKLTQSDSYPMYIGETEIVDAEEIVNTNQKTYKVVGITERLNYSIEPYNAPGYTMITYLYNLDNVETANISCLYKNPRKEENVTKDIINTLQTTTNIKVKIVKNSELLEIQGDLSKSSTNFLYGVASVVIVIIIISSVFVIRNSFSISVSEKTKQYGILSSIGATKKQIRKSVLLEGLIIGAWGIPLGILLGITAVVILLQVVNLILGDMLNGNKFVYNVPLLAIGVSALLGVITIYLSCIIPAYMASKISPIDAIRGANDVKIKNKKLKTSKLTKKLFGIGGIIASKNLKRSKKKYRTTVISLVVSVSIFISLSAFLNYGKMMTSTHYVDYKYNIGVYGCPKNEIDEITKQDTVQDYSYYYNLSGNIDKKYASDSLIQILEKENASEKEYLKSKNSVIESTSQNENNSVEQNLQDADSNNENLKSNIYFAMYNNDYFKKYIKSLGYNEKDYKNIAILYDKMSKNENGKLIVYDAYNIKDGEIINVNLKNEDKEVKISKRVSNDELPMGSELNNNYDGGVLFVSEDFIEDKVISNEFNYQAETSNLNNNTDTKAVDNKTKNIVYLSNLYIKSNNPNELETSLLDLKKQNNNLASMSVYNIYKEAKQMQSLILVVSIFLYGFIIVITLIGVTNIFNTITTNMILRSKEFAMLKSIGMTSKEFNRMTRLEGIMYGTKALLIGIPIGILGSYALYCAFAQAVDYGYILPWKAIIISAIFVYIIVGITMKYAMNKINKQNIIETIRNENI